MLDQRGQLLRAALGFAGLPRPSYDRSLWALRTWLDTWSGIGRIAVGMARQGFDLQLTRYDDRGWRATFYTTGMEHSPTSATGTGSGLVQPSRQVVLVGQSIVEPHLDGRLAVVADGEPGAVAGYVHRRMLGRVGEGELHRARNRALGAERCTGWAANLECHSFNLLIFHDR